MILVKKEKEHISISGHAMFDDYGKDIVCSAVSSIIITTINAITSFDKEFIEYKQEKKGIEIDVKSSDKITLTLINNMMLELKELSLKYPKNIQVKEG